MAIELEQYDDSKHDRRTVARLIFDSDPVFNGLVYGDNAIGVIEAMLGLGDNYFDYTRCAVQEGRVVGVIVGFPVSEKAHIDQDSGKGFARAMGFLRFLARMPLFMRMDKMMPAVEDESGYYVHTISVNPARGRPTEVGPVAPMEFHSLVGYYIYRLLAPVEGLLSRMTTRLDRYSELEAVLRRNPPFRMRVAHLAHVLGIGESTLSRNFRRDTGQTLKSYLKEQVVRRSKQALASTLTIKDVEAEFGFDDESYFSKFFKRETGFSPKEYRASLEREFG